MRIRINNNAHLGKTTDVEVNATPFYNYWDLVVGYLVLGKDLVDAGLILFHHNILDPEYEYFLRGNQVKVIQS